MTSSIRHGFDCLDYFENMSFENMDVDLDLSMLELVKLVSKQLQLVRIAKEQIPI